MFKNILFSISIAAAIGALAFSPPVFAQSSRVKRSEKSLRIPCPNVVTDLKEGAFYNRSSSTKKFPFLCFETSRNAKKAGYTSIAAAALRSYGGWYRIPFNFKSTTCSGSTVPAGTVNMFMQVNEKAGGLFAEVCPGSYRYSGSKTSSGFVLSLVRQSDDALKCPQSRLETTDIIQFENISEAKVNNITFQKLERCTDTGNSYSCSTTYEGSAFRESSELFPSTHGDIGSLATACTDAIKNCFTCHGGN